ncbi:putative PLP-dependent enzyme possibly involved in cell wall biogenesis [Terriglobus roseus DSM 18391]|uniref:Putative PLP-dependent enzyme possibly involved in cell wall biogenesis n=1 Tax=Terriglobus roseus (strain DSM 18391 / NRRL B-41598 / KBS 63) TaxID=926566 RepID=I3ZIL0_TERRK|nr:DegT/DnrJ/EryC1/StrS family aminotransferase [Terriglobus roseus]AFL89078.1 putative PLP-dependent enzyme possibly involved in cell wall biogenesis [Terriglobus roseus DSM 18391]
MSKSFSFQLGIVGAGPGGLAPLFAAARYGRLAELLLGGVLIVEKASAIGAGRLDGYTIPSDSPAEAFLDAVEKSAEPELRELLEDPTARALAELRGQTVPLRMAAEFLSVASQRLCSLVARSPGSAVLLEHEVVSVQQSGDRLWKVCVRDLQTGREQVFRCRSVHMATGAHQPADRLYTEPVGDAPLSPRFSDKLMQSGVLFSPRGMEEVRERLREAESPQIVIVGGSTSAGAAAVQLLRQDAVPLQAGSVALLHRSPLRLFYASAEDAIADGYSDFEPEDVCHISGRVFRLSGFRFEAKDLFRGALGLPGRTPDPRLKLIALKSERATAEEALERADLIIAAMGYRPRMCSVLDGDGMQIPLHEPVSGDWATVDQRCRVLNVDKKPLAGLTAMGLAVGPAASHALGGEANYRGQVNSLWLWQNTLGLRVVEEVLKRTTATTLPLMRPYVPTLSRHLTELQAIEESGTYSNFGPVNTRFEQQIVSSLFDGEGHCLTACNATLALMLAIKNAIGEASPAKRYALMPSFTFAAAAQAALWCGLTPLYCDIEPGTWLPSRESEMSLLQEYAGEIAVIVPNATFGNNLSLEHYEAISESTGIPIVVDAAASLGSLNCRGEAFGKGSSFPIVFSMHATKSFATGEGGLLYCSQASTIERLRTMASFGFGERRTATMPGLNAKMSEVAALTASLQLQAFPELMLEREAISRRYATELQGRVERQVTCGKRQARTFESVLLPQHLAPFRSQIMSLLQEQGVMTGSYFCPHLAQQVYLRERSVCPPLPVSDDIASRVLSLPLLHGMTAMDVGAVVETLFQAIDTFAWT